MEELLAELCKRLDYQNGKLIWTFAGQRSDRNGMQAGSVSTTDGYRYIKFRQKRVLAHRVVFFMFHGFLPKEIDHINTIRDDNRIDNLRDAVTHSNNLGNQSIQSRDKSSRFKGVCWDKNRNKWMAGIKHNRKVRYLGRFDSETDAAEAYNAASIEIYGSFANINKL